MIPWICTRCGEDQVAFGRVPAEALWEPSGRRPALPKRSAATRRRNH
jgi:hypothetical protein